MKAKLVGVDFDLVLANVTADRRDLADPFDRLQLVLHNEVLQTAKFGQPHTFLGWLKRVVVNLPQSGGVWSKLRDDAIGQLRGRTSELLRNSTACPIEVNFVLERDLDKAVAEHALATH